MRAVRRGGAGGGALKSDGGVETGVRPRRPFLAAAAALAAGSAIGAHVPFGALAPLEALRLLSAHTRHHGRVLRGDNL